MASGSSWPVLAGIAIACGVLVAAHAQDKPPASDSAGAPAVDTKPAPATGDAPPANPFSTKHAQFVPSRFVDLPGWNDDNLAEAWKAFRQSCAALTNRPAWSGPCLRGARLDARGNDEIRRFLEREFTLYEIRNTDNTPTGVITGYYEPLLNGSKRYAPPFTYPVYGVPDDLLFLDSRSLAQATGNAPILARVEGRNVVPVCVNVASVGSCVAPYALDLGNAKPDIRDKRIRVRVDGNRIVPYYTRREIDKGALSTASVIAWVDNLAALYSMHVQGSGKIRLPDGQIVRVAYAEQNGHPFTPPVRSAPRTRGLSAAPVFYLRGVEIPLTDEGTVADPVAAEPPPAIRPPPARVPEPVAEPGPERVALAPSANIPVTPPATKPANTPANTPANADPGKEDLSPEVARMVELLLLGTGNVAQHVPTASTPPAASSNPARVEPDPKASGSKPPRADPDPKVTTAAPARAEPEAKSAGTAIAEAIAKFTGIGRESVWSSDPSFVFFRQIPDSDSGPLGALGVPLTPGRSVAVDPRTTPLGSPVFISTEGQTSGTRVNRLMFAQDTGGAIRGAVRADYFWGFGPSAFESASRMKENGRMWLLLPKDVRVAAGTSATLTRGIRTGGTQAECLIPDPDLCVE